MHLQALAWGDNTQDVMNSLIQTSTRPPAEVWTPLDVSDESGRSGWHVVASEDRQLQRHDSFGYGRLIHCTWPTAFLREHLGPNALLPDTATSSLEIEQYSVRKKNGQFLAQIPRYFRTVGVQWSMRYQSSRWQGRGSHDAAHGATVATLDADFNLAEHDPNLIVGPAGPVFYQDPAENGHNVVQRRLQAVESLMELPPSTPVTLVTWHDEAGTMEDDCACFGSQSRYYDRYWP